MALERQAHLQDAEAQQDQANGPDERKDKVAEIIHCRQRVIDRQSWYRR